MQADYELRSEMADRWWLFLISGICWILFSLVVLEMDLQSVGAIGILAGFAFMVAGFNEFFVMSAVQGWRWLHATLGVLFILTGIGSLMWPGRTFLVLANLVAFFLIFKGTFDLVLAFATKGQDLWWVRLVTGILNILIAFWAAGYPGRSITFLVLWVGFSCLFRGITEMVVAFQLRGLRTPPAAPA